MSEGREVSTERENKSGMTILEADWFEVFPNIWSTRVSSKNGRGYENEEIQKLRNQGRKAIPRAISSPRGMFRCRLSARQRAKSHKIELAWRGRVRQRTP